ncbi:pullulanase-type alpha-1,6-glucosidase [Microbulbifer halophilus]|uniref:Pullulanase-type alpha-1,6-glucosidase n=1 Tax=Microbulbifer halophilus TaxID=453963 RepID=A0ABW5EHW1_9GAMM|nr:pullulanase-type alpha-1,6-glucosidase [Microbulbifer halophilus]MCW8127647.1 pullulanase-type alpha-1,6-glucosidase [Microbulbifer halophilus]
MRSMKTAVARLRAPFLLSGLFAAIHLPAQGADTPDPAAVNIPGSIQSQIGCPGDWQPECAVSMLTYDPADDKWRGRFFIPAGDWEYKAALNGSWNENYGQNAVRNGGNIPLNLATGRQVKFIYDHESHWIADDVNATIATAAGNFQSQLDCPGNWQPDCLASWMQDADGDGIYTFITDGLSAGSYEFKVALNENWDQSYGKDGDNLPFTVAADNDEIYFAFDPISKQVSVSADGIPRGDLSLDRAHWVDAETFAWNIAVNPGDTVKLHYSADAELQLGADGVSGDGEVTLEYLGDQLGGEAGQKFPHLSDFTALQLPTGSPSLTELVTRQLALAVYGEDGKVRDATGVQLAGALDDRFYYDGELGARVGENGVHFNLWAPTARSVKLHLFSDASAEAADRVVSMTRDADTGVWSADVGTDWDRKFYLYEVEVYSYFSREEETNLVTDPYSLSLSINSGKSQIVNLDDRDLKPRGWDRLRKPPLERPEDISVYELHVRDFSIEDGTVDETARGTFAAFADRRSRGMRHLKRLSRSGLTHVHLLPAFDFATVNEDRSQQERTPDLSDFAPDSTEQQAAVNAVRDTDGFNWGYDPLHFTVPEGSYSTEPDGTARIREFRQMVQALSRSNLRVIMDVVYNHTSSFGQYDNSVLDKIVPGYYHRRNGEGAVEMSSCCANTASEHAMMEKLMLDSLETWASAYKVDGFRFDLMGHHSLDNILKAKARLQTLTPEEDGVEGDSIYLYGEGWNFGEVADDARFVQARQWNMAGSGVGTFNDRIRDSVRGGNPFDGYEEQGFGNGLFTDSNGKFGGGDERATLLTLADKVRISLAGNLADYPLEDSNGNMITGAELVYNGQPTGYTADPQESINYIAAHDNETLFDSVQIKAPADASLAERMRMHSFSNSLVLFAQGIPFIHAGQEFLRSKSLDRDSYNSGDWFNALDFSFRTGNWGKGLPIADKNEDKWPLMAPLLAAPELAPERKHRLWSIALFREQLAIRNSSPLFRLPDAESVEKHLSFLNTGPEQVPGLIAMQLRDTEGDIDPRYERILVLFNGDDDAVEFSHDSLRGSHLMLHPRQWVSADWRLHQADFDRHSGTFTLPGRSTVVFVKKRRGGWKLPWLWD